MAYDALNRKNPDPMEDNIDMTNHSIINLKDPHPSDASHAASVNFVNKTVSGSNVIIDGMIDKKIQESEERSIQTVQQENVFEKVMVDDLFILDDGDVHKVAVMDKDFHKVNQQTYQFKIDYDSKIGYYSTRLGVNVVYLPTGYYTIVFEMYFSNKIDPDKITINASSGTLSFSKINTKKSADHTRSVINFHKAIIYPSDDELDIEIALINRAGQSYESDTQIFVVVYGVAATQNDLDARLWDRYFYINDKQILFEAPIDMNNGQIKNIGDGNENGDAANVKQLNEMETNISNHFTKLYLDLSMQFNNFKSTINNSLAKLGYYYFTDHLKHDNGDTVKFPEINSHPYSAVDNSEFLKTVLDGHYQIIYVDFFKDNNFNQCQLIIHDDTNGNNLFVTNLEIKSGWTPMMINAVIPITVDNGFNYVRIKMYLKCIFKPLLKGKENSTFLIKYLHA